MEGLEDRAAAHLSSILPHPSLLSLSHLTPHFSSDCSKEFVGGEMTNKSKRVSNDLEFE